MVWKGAIKLKKKEVFMELWMRDGQIGMVKTDGMGWGLKDMRWHRWNYLPSSGEIRSSKI